ncbi:glycosyltransferase [Salinisphaera sp. LB1]|uniref:glycosyltransferase n=1 Tax=Salinisphaera sp. LB1 TaxID=2183911 RepID=UPI000D705F0F|nr:glycosyltransferase [Salinisphaera sp. LB1]AWN14281.1 Glycosyl transferase, group 1 [Salinisphaera sp. LB1]
MNEVMEKPRIAFFVPSLTGGGVERVTLTLAGAFAAAGYPVDIVVTRAGGDYEKEIPAGVTLHVLQPTGILRSRWLAWQAGTVPVAALLRPVLLPIRSSRILRHIAGLAAYLQKNRPAVLVSGMSYPNLVALWARQRAGVPVRVVVVEHNTLSQTIRRVRFRWRWRYLPPLLRCAYRRADAIVAVSHGVADDVAATTGLPRSDIRTIYNPVVSPELARAGDARPEDGWFAPGMPPVLIGIGRLTSAKRFDVLIRAFAIMRAQHEAHLLILGEGRERKRLEALVCQLGMQEDIRMPGFVDNPYRYMSHADLFVLSSDYEGLPTVLIEALACGCPVVSTDCPSGPREILDAGAFGELVPCGDDEQLAAAMARTLTAPPGRARQRARAQVFSIEASMQHYREVCFGG